MPIKGRRDGHDKITRGTDHMAGPSGPWGGGGNSGGGGGDDDRPNRGPDRPRRPGGNRGEGIPEIDDLMRKGQDQLRVLMGGKGGRHRWPPRRRRPRLRDEPLHVGGRGHRGRGALGVPVLLHGPARAALGRAVPGRVLGSGRARPELRALADHLQGGDRGYDGTEHRSRRESRRAGRSGPDADRRRERGRYRLPGRVERREPGRVPVQPSRPRSDDPRGVRNRPCARSWPAAIWRRS